VPAVTFQRPGGPPSVIDAPLGATARDVALASGVDGIVGECGGQAMCASCHVYVEEPFLALLAPITDDEDAMLDSTASPRLPNSRLSCQIRLTAELDGLILHLPKEQI
jgi:2Fe-2S ferredoxin